MVEFAIIANILFVIVLTCIEFARMNMVRNLAQDAAYFAARQVIVPGATKAEAIAQAEGIMSSMLEGGYTVDVDDFDFDSNEISVTITVDLSQVALFIPMFLNDHEIETTAVMRSERYEARTRLNLGLAVNWPSMDSSRPTSSPLATRASATPC